jgi:hypothetical protein
MDPMLLVAKRSFQDMRDVADRERLLRDSAPDGAAGVAAALSRIVRRIAGSTVGVAGRVPDATPTEAPTAYDHPLLNASGAVSLVEAQDRESAHEVLADAQRLVDARAVHGGSRLAGVSARR